MEAIETASYELQVAEKALSESVQDRVKIESVNALVLNVRKLISEFELLCEKDAIIPPWTYDKPHLHRIDNGSIGATDHAGRIGNL